MATDELEGWLQVAIGGHDHSDVVVTIDRKRYEVDRQGDIDPLLLGRCFGQSGGYLSVRVSTVAPSAIQHPVCFRWAA